MKYQAFISYSSTSKDAALTLHRRLENFAVPKALRGRNTFEGLIGKDLGKFFVDRAELSATHSLEHEVKKALSESSFLIVLCTPDAAKSRWVPLEIRYFNSLGRKDRLLPVLLDGQPLIFDQEVEPDGAFPKELFDTSPDIAELPLAPDFRDPSEGNGDGFEIAFLKIVARLLGVSFPEMTQRHLIAEREKRRARNRIIGALAVMLAFTLAGGTMAWLQKQAADHRLAQAVESASRQVHLATTFRTRYGIPSSLSKELFISASHDFSTIVSDAGQSPSLLLSRARYSLGMADLVADLEGSDLSSISFVRQASQDIEAAQRVSAKWYSDFWFHRAPSSDEVLREKVTALSLYAKHSAARQQSEEAIQLGERALELSKWLGQAIDQTSSASFDAVFSQCALADIFYKVGKRREAEAGYDACLASAKALFERKRTAEARSLLVNALIDFGMIVRLQAGREGEAETLHLQASQMAREELADQAPSTEDLLLLATTLVSLADTLNLSGQPPEDQIDLYGEASDILQSLASSDPNRKDWKVLGVLAAYRQAGLYARQAIANENPTLLHESELLLSRGIATLKPLVRRFPDDSELARTLSAFFENRAEILILRADFEGLEKINLLAADDLEALLELRKELLVENGQNKVFIRDLANAHLTRGRLGSKLDYPTLQAIEQLANARTLFSSLETDPDFHPNIHRDLAITSFTEARLWSDVGKQAEACHHARKAYWHMVELTDSTNRNEKHHQERDAAFEQAHAYCHDLEETK